MTVQEKHVFIGKRKVLAAKLLARKIGYLRTQDFPSCFFDNLPSKIINAHRILRPKHELFIVQNGAIEIWHSHHDMLVTELEPGALFGDMSLLGQTMLGCLAIAGSDGVSIGVMSLQLISDRIKANPLVILEGLGRRLALMEAEHYRAIFQTVESRLAGLLLKLAGAESSVKGFTHEELGEQLGTYRETVTNVLDAMRLDRLIEIGRKRIGIIDKKALRELSEL
jgi:CRP/FNR family transcriptional regulator, cyclic AMP receptor protein